jgi:outer membrane protein assembly factor BamB
MLYKIFLLVIIPVFIYSQQQADIPWPTLADSPWPMIKHDPQFTGRSPYKGPQTPTIIWTADLENGIFSGPVIGADSNLYFGSYYQDPLAQGLSDYFYCYTPDGDFKWQYKTGSSRPPQTGILIDSANTIYFGSLDKHVYALNPDGSLKWKYETSAAIPEITIPNIDLQGNIYISDGFGELYSLRPDGTKNWNMKYENGFFGKAPVFSPEGETIYIAGRDSNLFALDLNGSVEWKFSCGKMLKDPAVDSEGNIYILPQNSPTYYYSLFPDGTVRWKYFVKPGSAGSYSVPAIDANGNTYIISYDSIYIGYYPLALISLDYNGEFRWKYLFTDVGPDHSDDFWQPLICDSEGTVYVGSTFGYYYYAISSDGRLKWRLPLEFPTKQVDNTGAISKDGTLYLGVHGSSLGTGYTKTLIAIKDTGTVSVNEDNPVPEEFSLFQNYPNPFNPLTTIEYNIDQPAFVNITVYDMLGRETAVLVNEDKRPGRYSVQFNGFNLSSGIYFYKLQANGNSIVKTMVLLK